MIEARAIVVNPRGLHARPAAKLAKLASAHACDIRVHKGKRSADAKSIAALLMLAAAHDSELRIRADGEGENEAAAAILNLIATGFNDDDAVIHPQSAAPTKESVDDGAVCRKVSGIGVTEALIVGNVRMHAAGDAEVPRHHLEKRQATAEIRRYEKALATARAELGHLRELTAPLPGAAEILPFIELHKMLLDDPEFSRKPQELIARRRINAEWALKERVDVINDSFRRAPDSYLRERGRDIGHVMERLLAAMKAPGKRRKMATAAGEDLLLVAADLDPADVIRARRLGYLGFVTESGGANSHTAILARSMGMPALVGARGAMECARHEMRALLDAKSGHVIFNPPAAMLGERDNAPKTTDKARPSWRGKRAGGGTRSADGERVLLHANVDLPDDIGAALAAGADGIGLFRSEFLFLGRNDLPGEDEQFEIYRDVLARARPLPVVIRTLDLGGDKLPGAADKTAEKAANPALGMRAIRYCLANPDLFLTQLRALLRAGAAHRNLRLLLPMLSHPSELAQAMALLGSAREQLRATRGIDKPAPPVGGMIEVPSSVFVMPALAKNLDFFSIGTNDLTQYALAIDRDDESLADLYDPLHPAIPQLLAMIVANARRANRPVTLCGEIAGDPAMTRLMLALGLRSLSMSGKSLEAARRRVMESDCAALERPARRLIRAGDPAAIRAIVDEINETP